MLRRLVLLLAVAALAFAQKRPFDVNAMMELKRIADPQISPDGRWVTFTVQTVDLAANRKPQQIWIMPGPDASGGAPRQITHDGEANQRARWSPDTTPEHQGLCAAGAPWLRPWGSGRAAALAPNKTKERSGRRLPARP